MAKKGKSKKDKKRGKAGKASEQELTENLQKTEEDVSSEESSQGEGVSTEPVEEAPVEEAPVEEAPVEEAPAEEAPVEEAPAEEAPAEEAPAEEAPAEEAPAEEAPAEEAPAEEAPAEEAPVEEVPVEEVPVEEVPVEEVPVEEEIPLITLAEKVAAPVEEEAELLEIPEEAPVGKDEEEVRICVHCGKENRGKSKFCTSCGKSVEKEVELPGEKVIYADLIIYDSKGNSKRVSLLNEHITVGRVDPLAQIYPDIDLTFFDSEQIVSRRHCEIYQKPLGQYFLVDIGSSNGTFLNRKKIQKGVSLLINDGDEIHFAKTRTIFYQSLD